MAERELRLTKLKQQYGFHPDIYVGNNWFLFLDPLVTPGLINSSANVTYEVLRDVARDSGTTNLEEIFAKAREAEPALMTEIQAALKTRDQRAMNRLLLNRVDPLLLRLGFDSTIFAR